MEVAFGCKHLGVGLCIGKVGHSTDVAGLCSLYVGSRSGKAANLTKAAAVWTIRFSSHS